MLASVGAYMQIILSSGPLVIMPIILVVVGVTLGQKFTKAVRSCLLIGVGIVGINLLVGLLFKTLIPVTKAMVNNMGVTLDILDVGWSLSAAVSYGSEIVPVVLPTILIVNFIMLVLNLTKTADVDIWNYWQMLFCAAIVYHTTNNNWMWTIIATVVCTAVTLILADLTAPMIQEFFGVPGISLPHVGTVGWWPLAIVINKLLDNIPGINKINLTQEMIQERLGLGGEPVFMGFCLGAGMGMLAKYRLSQILSTAMTLAAVMVILPRMVEILREGLTPLSQGIKEYLGKRFPNRKFYIGLDTVVIIGHPAVISTAIIMIPLTIFMAGIIPGNRVLPLNDLIMLTFILSFVVAVAKGNIFRTILIGLIIVPLCLLIATDYSSLLTVVGESVDFKFPAGISQISSFYGGTLQIPWLIWKLLAILGGYYPGS